MTDLLMSFIISCGDIKKSENEKIIGENALDIYGGYIKGCID